MKLFKLRELISRNIDRFKEGVDFIDLKIVILQNDNNLELLLSLGYSKMEIAKAEHLYLLSERGYTKLVSMLDNSNDKKWKRKDICLNNFLKKVYTFSNFSI